MQLQRRNQRQQNNQSERPREEPKCFPYFRTLFLATTVVGALVTTGILDHRIRTHKACTEKAVAEHEKNVKAAGDAGDVATIDAENRKFNKKLDKCEDDVRISSMWAKYFSDK